MDVWVGILEMLCVFCSLVGAALFGGKTSNRLERQEYLERNMA